MQDIFIKNIQNKTRCNKSFIYEVADVLDIGYDAAYRRINIKTHLTLEEAVLLARHFNVSLNNLFEVAHQNSVLTELSQSPVNEMGLERWFKEFLNTITPLSKNKKAEIIWSGKDLSLFRTLSDSYLTKYKLYVWLKDLNPAMAASKISFDEWVTEIPDSLIQSASAIGNLSKHINISELWNDQTINNTLHQILYYYEEGLVSKNLALLICEDLKEVINAIERETTKQSKNILENKRYFRLYKCDLHSLTNTLMIVTPTEKTFFLPFTILDYFKIEHIVTCDKMYAFLQKQISISKLLAKSGEHDRTQFFKTMQQKIASVIKRINVCEELLTF